MVRSRTVALSMLSMVMVLVLACGAHGQGSDPFSPDEPSLVRRGSVGMALGDWDPERGGVEVQGVLEGTPAERDGMRAGDRVFAINGRAVDGPEALIEELRLIGGGATAEFLIEREGERTTVRVTLDGRVLELPGVRVRYGEVATENGYSVRTVVMSPVGAEAPRPAVFFIQGITCSSIDQTSISDRGLGKTIQDVARAGYVVLLVEKPGIGDSGGPSCDEYGFHEEMQAYRAGLAALRRHPLVDPERIFLVGISLGGLQAPLLAVEPTDDGSPGVAGVAVFGTCFVPWTEYMVANVRRQTMLRGSTPDQANDIADAYARYWSLLLYAGMSPGEIMEKHPELERFGLTGAAQITAGRSAAFFRELHGSNWASAWSVLDAHAMAIHGSFDYVCDRRDHEWIVEVVNNLRPGRGEFVSIPGMSHGMTVWNSEREAIQRGLGRGEPSDLATEALIGFFARVGNAVPGE
ncbi:MAG: alpha/beta fold hydrolase [Phycisphaerales bacterium]